MHWYYRACLLAFLGQRADYDRHVTRMLDLFGNTTDQKVGARLAKAAVLLPGQDEHRQAVARMLGRCAGDGKEGWYCLAKALADHRGGHAADAVRTCELIDPPSLGNVAGDAAVHLVRALARHAAGDTDQAHSDLLKARQYATEKHLPSLESGRISAVGIEDWLVYQTLLREAQSAFPGE